MTEVVLEAVQRAHRAAIARGAHRYTDPVTGYQVMTELAHLARGTCCGSGCRHCPYEHAKVPPERREMLPPPIVLVKEDR